MKGEKRVRAREGEEGGGEVGKGGEEEVKGR